MDSITYAGHYVPQDAAPLKISREVQLMGGKKWLS